MAGIGFELKKLFQSKGVFASLRAFGYAAVITTGPMLLGFLLILGLMGLCMIAGTSQEERELLGGMITYTLFASMLVTSVFSMVITRFTADMLYEQRNDEVLPSFWGCAVLMMGIGGIIWFIFLIFSGVTFLEGLLLFIFFEELVLVWHAMSFLTAIKDYRGIFLSFLAAIATVLLVGGLLLYLGGPVRESMLFAVSAGYGIMLLRDAVLLHRYFPSSETSAFAFMQWIDKFQPLVFIGLFSTIGIYAHLIIFWFSDIGNHLMGLFYSSPYYDVPTLLAFMSIMVTTVNFVVSVEVNFYSKYRNYSSLYCDGGIARDIMRAEREMLKTLKTELLYTALKQLFFTVLCIGAGTFLLDYLPLGFNELMRGYFRTLCVAYGLYAIGNMLMQILLYFVDYWGALWATVLFAVSSVLFTAVSLLFPNVYYGFGFLLSALIYAVVTIVRLEYYTRRLPYYILCVQPIVADTKVGRFARFGEFLDKYIGGSV